MLRSIGISLILMQLVSCNPGHKIESGNALIAEASKAAADEQVAPKSEAPAAPEVIPSVSVVDSQAQSQPQQQPDNDDVDNRTAIEPIPVGGAYLTCRFQNGQLQGSESYRLDCDVAPAADVKASIASAAFYKVDAKGVQTPLTIVSQDLVALKWTLQDSMSTITQLQVKSVLNAPGKLATALTTTVSPTMNLVQNPNYFLGGEPNSLTPDEDCIEFVPASGKTSHQNFTGLVSGPLGRMNDNVCTLSSSFLCRNVSAGPAAAKWVLSAAPGAFADGALACGAGYVFGFPLSAAEVREVIAIVDRLDTKIWVNMNDRDVENTFVIKFR